MMRVVTERDWKYLNEIKTELLNTLCARINDQTRQILQNADYSEYDKYLLVCEHTRESADLTARCFDDWRRSTITIHIGFLHLEQLLTQEHIQNLSDKARDFIKSSE